MIDFPKFHTRKSGAPDIVAHLRTVGTLEMLINL